MTIGTLHGTPSLALSATSYAVSTAARILCLLSAADSSVAIADSLNTLLSTPSTETSYVKSQRVFGQDHLLLPQRGHKRQRTKNKNGQIHN
jgi:hypothetical protein